MPPHMFTRTGQFTSSRQAPVTCHSTPAPAGVRRLARRTGGTPSRAAFVILIALLAGCSSSAPTSPSATPTRSAPAAASTAPAATSTASAAGTFTSRNYGYMAALPAGWSSYVQATRQWDGQGAPSDQDNFVDLFNGPGGVEAWATAAATKESLAAYTKATIRAAAAEHPCPTTPQTDQAITIGAEPARLLNMQCPPGSGFLVEMATTIHDGTAYVFTSENPTGSGNQIADRAAFRKFLAGIQLQR
jgi:hypothetical protein